MRLRLPAIFLFFCLTALAQSSLQFSVWTAGPQSVARGRMAIVAASAYSVTGSATQVRATISNLPPNSRGYVIEDVTRFPNTALVDLVETFGVKVVTTPQTPLGDYRITLAVVATAANGSKVTRTVEIPLRVRAPAVPPTKLPFPPNTPAPGLQKWEDNMRLYGKKHVNRNYVGCCEDQTGVWYYDGARAFLQIFDHTGDSSYLDFARRIRTAYRDEMLKTKGLVKYAIFPHGLREFYKRYGDQKSKDALLAMRTDPGFGYRAQWGAPWNSSREMAYSLSLHVAAESVGLARKVETSMGFEPGETLFDEHLAIVMGHFEQWFVSERAKFVYPFMVGLSVEALIDYYEVSGDPEVLWLLKQAADKMYPNPLTWHETSESMMIVEEKSGVITRGPAPDLNMMIAPLYGWVFQQTGDVKYRDIGDRLFRSGAQKAYLDGGKQFSQNYRWSFKYLEWRVSPGQGADAPAPPSSLSVIAQ